MPSTIKPSKKTSSIRKESCFKSFPKYTSNYYGAVGNSSRYGTQNTRQSTMFDKIYGQTPMKATRRISKNKRSYRMNEIARCSNFEQKEQYRLLIEQYRNYTLAETEAIFGRKSSFFKKPTEEKTVVIDLSDLPKSGTRAKEYSLYSTPKNSYGSFLDSSGVQSEKKANRFVNKAENFGMIGDSMANFKGKQSGTTVASTSTKAGVSPSYITPPRSHSVADSFSPSSPYLCASFVKDLESTYGRRERERKQRLAEEKTRARLLKEKREMKEELLSKMLEARLNVTAGVVEIPELTVEMEEEVDKALMPNPHQEILIERFNIAITRQCMCTLAGLNWLNDEVINFYMELIVERSNKVDNLPKAHAMNTFFYPKLSSQGYKSVRRWTRRVDIFCKDLIFFPIHLGVHWTLAVADLKSKEITYYDSMGSRNDQCLHILKNYFASEHEDKKKTSIDVSSWKTINKESTEIPQQENGSDCGVFSCMFAEFISRKANLSFGQSDMQLLRRTMVWEIAHGSLTR